MKLFKMLTSALFVAILCLLAVPAMSAEPANLLPGRVGSLSIFITLGLLGLAIGLRQRALSKPPSALSIDQPKK